MSTYTPTGTASARLGARLALTEAPLRAAAAALWQPEGLRARYLDYLVTMHMVIRASVPLMRSAALRCRCSRAADDPLAGPLSEYFDAHVLEEQGHDDWLAADLRLASAAPASGPDAGADGLLAQVPAAAVASLVGAQYYWIEHHHPVALLGYIAVLEGCAPPAGLAERLSTATGLPPAAFRTVREHSVLDTGHVAGLHRLLDRLPLTRAHESAVALSALHSADAVMRLFLRLARAPHPTEEERAP